MNIEQIQSTNHPSTIMTLNTLQKFWAQYQKLPAPDTNNYKGDLGDAVFDITTADTFIAGIVNSLIERQPINDSYQKRLRTPLLNDKKKAFISMTSGKENNLETVPEALNYVIALDKLRMMALSYTQK